MFVGTRIPATSHGALAWWVKCTLDGFALGCAPQWRAWKLPPLYSGKVRFRYEPRHGTGDEEFAQPPIVFARGWGDCDDLVNARLTELLARELPRRFYRSDTKKQERMLRHLGARMHAGKLPSTRTEWRGSDLHVLVRFPDGSTEDPAKILGAPH